MIACLQSGIASLAWGPSGYQVMVAEAGSTGQVLEVGFAKSLQASHRVAANRQASPSYPNQEVHLLQVWYLQLSVCLPCEACMGNTAL